jgi:hypothetical protein
MSQRFSNEDRHCFKYVELLDRGSSTPPPKSAGKRLIENWFRFLLVQ